MANAKECDRCGELYKEKSLVPSYIVEHKNLINYFYDLCPKCYSSFTQWLNKYKQKEEDNAG
ncbi:hypothetical protein [Ruminococcus difficilis]|uniref:Uncharacterized protein n=1 Tax=Ruminococcus difficilis TaxID=2763069 RepID=A0A934WTI5_9FIRM|nr:hypothetical protein [Ruminococcus difficilis]MBK6089649.1 hypothetical protein [Ruminococcus difficilis]